MIDTSKNMLYHLGNLNAENQRITYQTATKQAINKGSEDSLLHSNLINLEDKLRVTEGLKLQISKSQAINNVADTNLKEIKRFLGTDENNTIQTDLMKSLNAGMDRKDKLALATNLRGIRDDMFDRTNAKVDGEYIFAGSVTSEQTLVKDPNFDLNGKIEFGGDGFLREVAVQPGSYRDRGVTAYDVNFYTASEALAGESFTFSAGERIIDENGFEWKLNTAGDKLQKYDYNGNIYHPLDSTTEMSIDSSTAAINADTTRQSTQATYTINALPAVPAGRVFEAKHNYFDDLNIMINALEGQSTALDGTTAGVIDDALVNETLRNALEQTTDQFDASNIGHGELGGRNKVFNVAYDKLVSQETHYNILIVETGGVDLAKLALESKALELTYESLYTTIGKMNKLSLLNYIN